MPGARPGKLYTPDVLVTVVRATLVSLLVAVTLAFGMMAPVASLTSPVISPTVWAGAEQNVAQTRPQINSSFRMFLPRSRFAGRGLEPAWVTRLHSAGDKIYHEWDAENPYPEVGAG